MQIYPTINLTYYKSMNTLFACRQKRINSHEISVIPWHVTIIESPERKVLMWIIDMPLSDKIANCRKSASLQNDKTITLIEIPKKRKHVTCISDCLPFKICKDGNYSNNYTRYRLAMHAPNFARSRALSGHSQFYKQLNTL